MYFIFYWFICFLIYSFVGYIAELICVSFENKKPTNRGFLCGPICPIYGVGAIFMYAFLNRYQSDYFALFILGAILATILEYVTGWSLEKIFHNKWWDYSKHKFNINGRVCLSNALLFGLCSVIVVEFSQPFLKNILDSFNNFTIILIGGILLIIFIADMLYSWIVAFNLRHNIIIVEELKDKKLNAIPMLFEQNLSKRIDKIKKIPKRVTNSFPHFVGNYKIEFDIINNLISNKKKKKTRKKKK